MKSYPYLVLGETKHEFFHDALTNTWWVEATSTAWAVESDGSKGVALRESRGTRSADIRQAIAEATDAAVKARATALLAGPWADDYRQIIADPTLVDAAEKTV
ncbi:hypothetical protein [Lichenibacterium ramalinae]|uniref:Uncharacterized protein n=1 Tax=Lichenibacterium ramalinae TaxID=2316527 RepID=A0A4Q2R857_9HYPH|nr:hypothetical protein [Lichenibacterium ramalinae]RYB01889.1 hypothetical protein D3272_23595 [Lichenibacterium ramalinae]